MRPWSTDAPGPEFNPYAAPSAPVAPPAPSAIDPSGLAGAEALRRACLGRELTFRSLGLFHMLLAALALGLITWVMAVDKMYLRSPPREVVINTLLYLAFATVQASLGLGLYHLRGWARWGETAVAAFLLVLATATLAATLEVYAQTGRILPRPQTGLTVPGGSRRSWCGCSTCSIRPGGRRSSRTAISR